MKGRSTSTIESKFELRLSSLAEKIELSDLPSQKLMAYFHFVSFVQFPIPVPKLPLKVCTTKYL